MAESRSQRQWRERNREYVRAKNMEWYRKNRDTELVKRKEKAFVNQVQAAGRAPGVGCEICSRPFDGRPHWDHNHSTGEFRGWLCGSCNKALGLFQDLPDSLLAAYEYLRSRGFAAG